MFYEDDLVMGLCNFKPVYPGHSMVITKKHRQSFHECTDEELSAAYKLIKKIHKATQKIYGPLSYFILQKNGPEVSQSVPHVHFHYIPKPKTGLRSLGICTILKLWLSALRGPIAKEELYRNAKLMRDSIKTI